MVFRERAELFPIRCVLSRKTGGPPMSRFLPLLIALLASTALAQSPGKPLTVHEWGTFTSFQDESGRAIGYLNSSVEPLPDFVHNLRSGMILGGKRPNYLSKGIDMGAHPDITMRLETPVIYFHPEDATPFKIDVSATFNGGVLSE